MQNSNRSSADKGYCQRSIQQKQGQEMSFWNNAYVCTTMQFTLKALYLSSMACLIMRFLSAATASCLISGQPWSPSATSRRSRPTRKWFLQYSSVRLYSKLWSETHYFRVSAVLYYSYFILTFKASWMFLQSVWPFIKSNKHHLYFMHPKRRSTFKDAYMQKVLSIQV